MIDRERLYKGKSFWREEFISLLLLSIGLIYANVDFTSSITLVSFILLISKYSRLIIRQDAESIILFLTFFVIFFVRLFENDQLLWCLFFCLTPIFMYLLGRYYAQRWKGEDEILWLLLILAMSLAFADFYFTFSSIRAFGLINPMRALQVDSVGYKPVTQRAVEISLCCAGFALVSYNPKNRKQRIAKIIFVSLSVLASLCFVHYVSRSGLIFMFVSILVGFFRIVSKRKNKSFLFIIGVIIVISIIYMPIFSQVLGIFTDRGMEGSDLSNAGLRTERWSTALTELIDYPLGHQTDYLAHNFWLGIGQSYGIFPFLLLSLFSLINIIKSYKIIRRKDIPDLIRICVASFTLLFFLANFTECIHNGVLMFMFVYFFFCGMVNSIYYNNHFTSAYEDNIH